MSFSMSMNPMYYYLCDGVYWNWDAAQAEEDVPIEEYEKKMAMDEEVAFSKSFSSSDAYRSHHFFEVLNSNLPYIVNRYCRYESLPKDYAEVAMQRNVLKDIVFVHTTDLVISLTLSHIKKLDQIVLNIYRNKSRNSVYNRVAALQRFLHDCTLEEGKQIDHLDREVMRKLLSLCRLHIAISDVRKKNIDLIKSELIQNNLDLNQNAPIPYIVKLNRQYIPNWKKRHLRSLLHFCPQSERTVLKGLLNLRQPFNNAEVQKILFQKDK